MLAARCVGAGCSWWPFLVRATCGLHNTCRMPCFCVLHVLCCAPDEGGVGGGGGLDAGRQHALVDLESLLRLPALVTRADDSVVCAHLRLNALQACTCMSCVRTCCGVHACTCACTCAYSCVHVCARGGTPALHEGPLAAGQTGRPGKSIPAAAHAHTECTHIAHSVCTPGPPAGPASCLPPPTSPTR